MDRPLSDTDLARMASGMPVLGSRTREAEVERLSGHRFRIVLKEGRNRQIRRMVRKLGRRVIRLRRIRVAGIRLGRLPEGRWRHLTPKETQSLQASVKVPRQSVRSDRRQAPPDSG